MFSNFLPNLNKTLVPHQSHCITLLIYLSWCSRVNLFQSGSMWLMRSWRDDFHAAHGPWRWPAAAARRPRPGAPPLCPVVGPAGPSTPDSGRRGRNEREAAVCSSDCPACSPSASWSSAFWVCDRWSGTGKPAPTALMPALGQAVQRCPDPTLTLPARSEHRKKNRTSSTLPAKQHKKKNSNKYLKHQVCIRLFSPRHGWSCSHMYSR